MKPAREKRLTQLRYIKGKNIKLSSIAIFYNCFWFPLIIARRLYLYCRAKINFPYTNHMSVRAQGNKSVLNLKVLCCF